jgi:hypothetical protein
MTYRVKWHRRVIRQLAAAYLAARTAGRGAACTAASAQLEALLAEDPASIGESRSGGRRVVVICPLVVDFVVHPHRQRVVVRAARYRAPKGG